MSVFQASIFRLACHERAKVEGEANRARGKQHGKGRVQENRRPFVFIDINMVCPLCQFLAAISETRFPARTRHGSPTKRQGKRKTSLWQPVSPVRFGIFPTSYFVSFHPAPYFFFLPLSRPLFLFFSGSVVLLLPPWKYHKAETASWREQRQRDAATGRTTGCINFRKLFLPRCNVRIKGMEVNTEVSSRPSFLEFSLTGRVTRKLDGISWSRSLYLTFPLSYFQEISWKSTFYRYHSLHDHLETVFYQENQYK